MTRNVSNGYESEWYKFLYNNAPVGLARTRLDTGEFVDCNQHLIKLFGYSNKDRFIQSVKAPELYVNPLERATILEDLLKNGYIEDVDVKLKKKGGAEFWGRFSARIIPNENQLEVVLMDSTKEHEIIDVLRESERKYKALFESLGDAVFLHDMEGNFLEVNDVACERLGYSKEEFLKLTPMDIDAEEYAALVPERINELKTKGHIFYETEHVAKDGTKYPTELSSRVVDLKGEPVVVTIARDISQRLRNQRKIQKQKEFLENVINSLEHPFYVIDIDTYEIRLANQATESQYGTDAITCHQLTHGKMNPCAEDEHFCPLEELKSTGQPVSAEHIHRTKTGEERVFEIHAHPIFDNSGNLVQMIEYSLDITERKKAAALRKRQQRELELYASLLKHDLSNDLQVIMGGVDIAKTSIDEEDKELRELLDSADAAARRMSHLLSVLGRPEEEADNDLLQVLERELEEASNVHKNFTFELNPPKETNRVKIRSSKLLPMVFENLFRNAAQHAGNDPHVDVNVVLEEDIAHVYISDNGSGIPDSLRNEIFKRKSSEKSGFGLYLAKEVMKMLDGNLTLLKPADERGATFKVSLLLEN